MYQKPKNYVAISQQTTEADHSLFYDDVKAYGRFTGLFWIMTPAPTLPSLPIKTIENIIFSEEFLNTQGNDDQIAYLTNNAKRLAGLQLGRETTQHGIC